MMNQAQVHKAADEGPCQETEGEKAPVGHYGPDHQVHDDPGGEELHGCPNVFPGLHGPLSSSGKSFCLTIVIQLE